MSTEQIQAEIEKLKSQQRVLENDFHALRGAIIAYESMLKAMNEAQAVVVEQAVDNQ